MHATTKLSYRASRPAGAFDTIAALALSIVKKPVQFYKTRSELNQLSAMSDHELSDIGLSRTDLYTASAYPADKDPTSVLADIVQERRHWRRGG